MVSLQIAFWRLICMAFSRGALRRGGGETIFGKSDAKLEGQYLGLVKVTEKRDDEVVEQYLPI